MVEPSSKSTAWVEYPETDGEPMTESDATRNYLVYCVEALRLFFQSRPRVYVSGNLFVYYQEGQPEKKLSPDVFVVFGVSKRERRSYQTWREGGKLPAFVLEITSLTTKKQDEETKPERYVNLGVQEYFQYDPTGDYLNPQLKGKRLINGQYEPIQPETFADGTLSIPSQTLGLDLRLLPTRSPLTLISPELASIGRELRLFDPRTGAMLLNYQEAEQARQEAEQAKQEAEQAKQEAEQRAEQAEQQLAALMERLRSQGIDPNTL
jgi:Uma2 family endonuclease